MTSWRRVLLDFDLLPLCEAVDSGGDDARSGVETTGHLDAGCVPRKIDPAQRDGAGGKVDNPNKALSVLAQHGGGGHVQGRALAARLRGDGRSQLEACGRIVQGNSDAPRACYRISLRRNLPNLALDLDAGKKLQADDKWQADRQGNREVRPDVDNSLSDVGARDCDDALAGRHDLSDVGARGRNDTREVGFQLRIAELLQRLGQVRLRTSH